MKVEFGGETIPLNCRVEDEAYCRFLAEKIRALAVHHSAGNGRLAAAELLLLAAMAMADELYGGEYESTQTYAAEAPDVQEERAALQSVFKHF